MIAPAMAVWAADALVDRVGAVRAPRCSVCVAGRA